MGRVLVIGGGVAGIQAALDLGDRGHEVYLVEKKPSIGGRMAQLDKTFPTNDCSICILAPKMLECFDHPNVTVITNAEVKGLEGSVGNYTVMVVKKPRYVDEAKCTGCGDCSWACRLKDRFPDEFNMGLGNRSSIYLYFIQAVPRVAIIDDEHCLMLTKGKCGESPLCVDACGPKAIDFEQKPEEIVVDVDAIIVATGYDFFDPTPFVEYGYGVYKNVITAFEYERLICAGGPKEGHLVRPSDGGVPKTIAFIQCVGVRDRNNCPYCCAVCCLNSTKSCILAKEHYPDIETYVLYSELRAGGKRSQEYLDRARDEYGLKYIRGRPGELLEDKETNNLIIKYENIDLGKIERMEVELVVLNNAPIPSKSTEELAKVLGIAVNECGFFLAKDPLFSPIETKKEGIFLVGYAQGPKDIPESVAQASAAAAKASEIIERKKRGEVRGSGGGVNGSEE
jgi:heterodisulfide reductase subunit A